MAKGSRPEANMRIDIPDNPDKVPQLKAPIKSCESRSGSSEELCSQILKTAATGRLAGQHVIGTPTCEHRNESQVVRV